METTTKCGSFLLNSNKKLMGGGLLILGVMLLLVSFVLLPKMPSTPAFVCLFLGVMWSSFSSKVALEFAPKYFWYKLAPMQGVQAIQHENITNIIIEEDLFTVLVKDKEKPIKLPKKAFNELDLNTIQECFESINISGEE